MAHNLWDPTGMQSVAVPENPRLEYRTIIYMSKSHPKVPIYDWGLKDITYTNSTALYIPANIISVVFFFNSSMIYLFHFFEKFFYTKENFFCDIGN